jgi:DNA-binding transcriptional regulator LsrR (DeoR family)
VESSSGTESVPSDEQKLDEAEANLRGEIANAVYGVGLGQADVANALGWPRQRIHEILAADSGLRKRP